MPDPTKCVGLFGRLFGHKFLKRAGDCVYRSNYCWRCGMPMGGRCGQGGGFDIT